MNSLLLIINILFCSYFVYRKLITDKNNEAEKNIENGDKSDESKEGIIDLMIPNELKINEWLYIFMEAEVIIYISKLLLSLIIKKGLLQFLYFMLLTVILVLLYMSIVIPARKLTITKNKYTLDKTINLLNNVNCTLTEDFLLIRLKGDFFGTYLVRIEVIKYPFVKKWFK